MPDIISLCLALVVVALLGSPPPSVQGEPDPSALAILSPFDGI